MQSVTITELACHPIKSCKGFSIAAAALDTQGLVGDRRFLIVNEHGRFLTQREHARMALIEPILTDDGVTLHAPNMQPLTVQNIEEGAAFDAVIWDDTVRVVSQGAEAAAWLSAFLGISCRLVHMERGFVRLVDKEYAVRPTDQTSFADGYPLLLISEASLNDLNTRIMASGGASVPMNRFRPNIIVTGCEAFAEDCWRRIRIGGITFDLVKPCARCNIPTIDQTTAHIHHGKEPVVTLKTYRKSVDGKKILFGQNLIHNGAGTLNVGDAVEILA